MSDNERRFGSQYKLQVQPEESQPEESQPETKPETQPHPQPHPHQTDPIRARTIFIVYNNGERQRVDAHAQKADFWKSYKLLFDVGNVPHPPINTRTVISEKVIGSYAFYDCKTVQKILLNRDLEIIENYAFGNCFELRYVTMYDKIERIGAYIFEYCKNITIRFMGTKEQWLKIKKHPNWADHCIGIVVRCFDDIIKY